MIALANPPFNPAFCGTNFAWAPRLIHEHQSRTLATLRDTLLPKLLSGELSSTAAKEIREVFQ